MNSTRKAIVEFLEAFRVHGGADIEQLWLDLDESAPGSPVTSDPAMWADWVRAFWAVRGVRLEYFDGAMHWMDVEPPSVLEIALGANPGWPGSRPVEVDQADEGDEIRQFSFFRGLVDRAYRAEVGYDALLNELRSDLPDSEISGWVDAE